MNYTKETLPAEHEDFKDIRQPVADFQKTIGRLTLRWARLESGLAGFLNSIVDGGQLGRGHVLYYSGGNLQPRLQIIDQLLLELIALDNRFDVASAPWKKLKKSIRQEASARRNPVVHGQLVGNTDYSTKTFDRVVVPFHGVRTRTDQPSFHVPDIEQGCEVATNLWRASMALGGIVDAVRLGEETARRLVEFEELLAGNGPPLIGDE